MLVTWAIGSIAVGIGLWLIGDAIESTGWRAVLGGAAAQCFIWGVIDGLFASTGFTRADLDQRDARNLIRTVRFSSKLDYVWLALGALLLVAGWSLRGPVLVGHGIGLLAQSLFLASFDRLFARHLARAMP